MESLRIMSGLPLCVVKVECVGVERRTQPNKHHVSWNNTNYYKIWIILDIDLKIISDIFEYILDLPIVTLHCLQ